MSSQRHERAGELFLAAMDLAPEQRAAFLDAECGGDDELRAEVASLLAHDDPRHAARADAAVSDGLRELEEEDLGGPLPEAIGGYRVLRRIGAGGMGVVYEAEQADPARRVALKVVRAGFVSPTGLRRCRSEAQVLGLLEHPGIARIYEAGTDDSGQGTRPWFAMELVRGEPITRYARRRSLTVRERLELIAQVCEAVHHAHEKGVIHRDLKPGNVLVDESGQPKVLDFGVARVTDPDLQTTTLLTGAGELVGTLPYMSPEQVGGDSSALDARSDVYALGVLAFELLTGRLPYDLDGVVILEAARIIREEEPTRLSSLDTTLAGDVETIVAKAADKDKTRRYGTAEELARDIRRFLRDEPIAARPPSATYQLRKFARRNRVLVASLAAIFVALLAGTITSTALYLEARNQARLAEKEADDVLSLSAIQRLEDLLEEADELWPARRERLDDMRAWEREAEALAAQLPAHRAKRAELEARALPWTEADRARDRREHPRAGELEPLRELIAKLEQQQTGMSEAEAAAYVAAGSQTEGQKVARRLEERRRELDQLEQELGSRWRYRFESDEERWWHTQLGELIAGLEAFADPERGQITGTSPEHGWGVRRRIDWVEGLEERTTTGAAARALWADAADWIVDVEECPLYDGLELHPQLGLLPIGMDPESGLFEFAHVATGEVAERGPDGRLTVTEDTGLVFVLIPGGALQMGAQSTDPTGPNYDPLARSDEAPVHEVQLEPFFLSKYQMNQGQWLRIAGANPSAHAPGSPTLGRPFTLLHPVEQVSFDDCEPMLARFELLVPTEAQWEWAARGGTTTRWWTGSDRESLVGACNLADQAAWRAGATWEACKDWPELDDGWPLHAPVTEFRPNPFGLHGTVGNVWEWTRCFAGSYTVPQRPGDGYREEFGSDPELRVTRGASFGNVSAWARVTYRNLVKRDVRGNYIGVRPARALEQ